MTRFVARAVLVLAGLVIVALTAGAFWLSYAHLHSVAADNGLSGNRGWAWPACLDAFIVAGELLMLYAAFQRKGRDPWAIGITAAGSLGSIALNVWGVQDVPGTHTALPYVVAAVPPSAALLAFGVLMRQVHAQFSGEAETVSTPVVEEAPEVSTPRQVDEPTPEEPQVKSVDTPPSTTPLLPGDPGIPEDEVPIRFPTEIARAAIEHGWAAGLSIRDTAQMATRSPSYVHRIFSELEETRGPRPEPAQLQLQESTT